MISDELKQIMDGLKVQGKMNFLENVSDEQINGFEEKNSLTLPSQYKAWLGISDGGELFLPAGVQFYGVAHKPIIDPNDNCRPSDNYVVIGALSNGDPVLYEKNTEKVSIYNQEAGRIEEDEKYDDFFSFLKDLKELLGIGG